MKKILAIMVVLFMAMTAMVPLISANGGYGGYAINDVWDGQKTGQTYEAEGWINVVTSNGETPSPDQGSGASQMDADDIKIVALWETKADNYNDEDPDAMANTDLDDCPLTNDWCQVDPPMTFDAYTKVRAWVALDVPNHITDPFDEEELDMIKFSRSWPNNELVELPETDELLLGLGDGSYDGPTEENKYKTMPPTDLGNWEDYDRAAMLDTIGHDFISYFFDIPTNYDSEYDWLYYLNSEDRLVIVYKEFELYYHDPAGWYDIEVTYQNGNWQTVMNYFEYVMGIGIETDFEILNWGDMDGDDLHKWFVYHGDDIFDKNEYDGTPYSEKPTIRSIGNWDAVLGVLFTQGTFKNNEDVRFNIRVGKSNDGNPMYYDADDGVDLEDTSSYFYDKVNRPGIKPGELCTPLWDDNSEEIGNNIRDNVLLKCHTEKLDFYVNPHQWNELQMHKFDIILSVHPPSYEPYNPYDDTANEIPGEIT
jgi:hypothetical protein